MRHLEKKLGKHIDLLIQRYPVLELCRQDIIWLFSYGGGL